jgi:hypothetical protein
VSDDGAIRLRPAAVLPVEMYTAERIEEIKRATEVDEDARLAVSKAALRDRA